jgi:glucose-6-phosphate isomerase
MDSSIGLLTMIAIGLNNFQKVLAGFHEMDGHFRTASPERNLPVLMGLPAVWYANSFGTEAAPILPYEHYLKRFPAYLQPLAMESNGKHVMLDGSEVDYQTCPIYWGEPGINGQHSFYQVVYQGTRVVSCDFIAFGHSLNPTGQEHGMLMVNVLAQSEEVAFGKRHGQLVRRALRALCLHPEHNLGRRFI